MPGACMAGGVDGRGACVAGGHACRGHAWQGVWMAGGHVWQGGMHGGACVARGACMPHIPPPQTPRDTVGQCAGGTHPTGMHSCIMFYLPNFVKAAH